MISKKIVVGINLRDWCYLKVLKRPVHLGDYFTKRGVFVDEGHENQRVRKAVPKTAAVVERKDSGYIAETNSNYWIRIDENRKDRHGSMHFEILTIGDSGESIAIYYMVLKTLVNK